MLFNSFTYLLFLPVVILVYYSILTSKSIPSAKCWVLFTSIFFYAYGALSYLAFLFSSIVVNFYIGRFILFQRESMDYKKSLLKYSLFVGVVFNIAFLGYFKYADFFIANINQIFSIHISLLRICLPLAISFYTFKQISFLVDCYNGKIRNVNFFDYNLFVTFFPQLISGPITRYNEMMPQFEDRDQGKLNYHNMSIGLCLITLGLFKSVVLAGTFGIWANQGYSNIDPYSFSEAWITSLSYTFQLYFDFSGYTDMAIGSAYFFNIKLPLNFNSPYLALNIQDFWRRWHITLSRFLRDYIYIPLGGNRKRDGRIYANIMITFLIGGIWHGAGLTFIVWGAFHGLAAVVHKYWAKFHVRMPNILSGFITFNFVNIAWVFFRSESIDRAVAVLKGMFTTNISEDISLFNNIGSFEKGISSLILPAAIIGVFFLKNSNQVSELLTARRKYVFPLVALLLISFLFMNSTVSTEFLYFDF